MNQIERILRYVTPYKSRTVDKIAEATIKIVAGSSILIILLIFLFVFKEASGLLFNETEFSSQIESSGAVSNNLDKPTEYNPEEELDPISNSQLNLEQSGDKNDSLTIWESILGFIWQPISEIPKFGIWPLVIGTAKTTFVAILIGAPLAILAAINVTFFIPARTREIIKPAIELLASFPSVVIGFFCLMDVASIVKDSFGLDFRLNAITGGIGLAIAVTPIIFTVAEDALSTVPQSIRQASLALGATEWQTAYRVMLPAALPGVFAAVLLGIGRAFGETMIALMATGNAPLMSFGLFDPSRTFAATIGAEMGEVIWGSQHYHILFFLGVLLFLFTFVLNAITELYVKKRLMKKFQGA